MRVQCPHCGATNNVAGLYVNQSQCEGTHVTRLYCGFCGESWVFRDSEQEPLRNSTTRQADKDTETVI